jgi:Flp pilus assembly pilin Flp
MLPHKARSPIPSPGTGDSIVRPFRQAWSREDGQGITEYALICALVLLLVIGTVRLVGSKANHAFSRVVTVFQPEHNDD